MENINVCNIYNNLYNNCVLVHKNKNHLYCKFLLSEFLKYCKNNNINNK